MLAKFRNLPLYLALLATFIPAALEKLSGGGTPEWFLKQFEGSLLDLFPGSLSISFYMIACLETASAIALIFSLAKGEFLPDRKKPVLLAALLLCEITFISLSFGQRITHKFDGAFQLVAYALLTMIAGAHVLRRESETIV